MDSGGVVRFLISSLGATAATIITTTIKSIGSGGISFEDDGGNACGGVADGGYGYWLPHTSTTAALAVNTIYTIAHGLGAVPSIIQGRLICDSAEYGWSVGDEIDIHPFQDGGTDAAHQIGADATNIYFQTGASGFNAYRNKSTNAAVNLTANKWKFKVRWWK
jgi:hypothetical protein